MPSGLEGPTWLTWEEVRSKAGEPSLEALAGWFTDYVMQPHKDVGRSGHICPYVAPSIRLNLARIAVSDVRLGETAALGRTLGTALALFHGLSCPEEKRIFRTVVVAFPNHVGEAGVAELEAMQRSYRFQAARHGIMIGLFEPDSPQPGIVNRAFHSFRGPMTLIAIRSVVEGDAPFILRNPLMIPVYLARFGRRGARRLVRAMRLRLRDKLGPSIPAPETA